MKVAAECLVIPHYKAKLTFLIKLDFPAIPKI